MTLVAKVIVKGKNRKKGPDNILSKILKKSTGIALARALIVNITAEMFGIYASCLDKNHATSLVWCYWCCFLCLLLFKIILEKNHATSQVWC